VRFYINIGIVYLFSFLRYASTAVFGLLGVVAGMQGKYDLALFSLALALFFYRLLQLKLEHE